METVGDVMTFKKIFFARPDTTIDEALEILVNNNITGLPVLDNDDRLVGVVSDFDLLSLDHISGERHTNGIFPDITTDWPAFQEVEKLILKNHGRVVEDVMTADPVTVDRGTSLEKAARLLLDKRIRRLPVVDENHNLVGMFSRGDVIRAALKARSLIRSVMASQDEAEA
jgi:CBS domain-containing protein